MHDSCRQRRQDVEERIPEIYIGYRIRGVQRRAKAPILHGPIERKEGVFEKCQPLTVLGSPKLM
jgi:hypothetical protein